jgi:hypothetical protein
VPYVVDNLWEWARPSRYPSRRYAKFANPTPRLAVESVGDGTAAYLVAFVNDDFTLGQLRGGSWTREMPEGQDHRDARYHPDCRALWNLVVRVLGGADEPAASIPSALDRGGRLFAPCLDAEAVEALFEHVAPLREAREEIREAVTYWKDVRLVEDLANLPDPVGEIHFTYPGGFRLEQVAAA